MIIWELVLTSIPQNNSNGKIVGLENASLSTQMCNKMHVIGISSTPEPRPCAESNGCILICGRQSGMALWSPCSSRKTLLNLWTQSHPRPSTLDPLFSTHSGFLAFAKLHCIAWAVFLIILLWQNLMKGSWSLSEVVHAIVIMLHFHALSSLVHGTGIEQHLTSPSSPDSVPLPSPPSRFQTNVLF